MAPQLWPTWAYFPSNARPPVWVHELVDAVAAAEATISTVAASKALTSNEVPKVLGEPLIKLGYVVESGKTAAAKIKRPVLFGENGVPTITYEIDAVHDAAGVVLEVEAGRGARGNAAYRDLIRASLILDARFLALLMPIAYRAQSGGRAITVPAYREARDMLAAIYASQRLRLPFEGVLIVGY